MLRIQRLPSFCCLFLENSVFISAWLGPVFERSRTFARDCVHNQAAMTRWGGHRLLHGVLHNLGDQSLRIFQITSTGFLFFLYEGNSHPL